MGAAATGDCIAAKCSPCLRDAAPCPDAEVIFARGTTELPGVGPTGDAFVNSLQSQVAANSVGVYAVNYPATTDFRTAVDGISDARAHILATAAACPQTKMVLGGFSQGAAVMGFVTANVVPDGVSELAVPAPMPLDVADHVAAVALFGKPSARFMRAIDDPQIVIGPSYVGQDHRPMCRRRPGMRPRWAGASACTVGTPDVGIVEPGSDFGCPEASGELGGGCC